ncbi:MAG: hypothetical protein LUQ47_04390, partial [Methanotrichaceae archaeon]|nr:hypothetical protein [Methanotrichaceae archaeon]
IKNLKTSVQGNVSRWVSLQGLPETILANDQKVFAASITVPQDAAPGFHNGTIEISKENENLLDIPISVNVAGLLDVSSGVGNKTGSLIGNEWNYYYLDMMPGTTEFEASLEWQQDTNLDLFLLSPTSEFYTGDKTSRPEAKNIKTPQSGRWLIAVHSENATQAANYRLQVTRSQLETSPLYWNLESAVAGTSTKTQFTLRNLGLSLNNLSYTGMIENTTLEELDGTVLYKKVWEYTVNATQSTKKLSAMLLSDDKTDSSEMMLVFENPGGEPADALLGKGDLGPLEIANPENGAWKVKVYGYNVPAEGLSFSVLLKKYTEDRWNWIETYGPQKIDSNENASLDANLTIPKNTPLPKLDGYIKISSDSLTFEIPVSLTIAGTKLEGLTQEEVSDSNNDGLFDILTLTFGLNITSPGEYMLRGVLADCLDKTIETIDSSFALNESGSIKVNVSSSDIWMNGKCGPMTIQNLILYDKSGNYIDRFDKKIAINREPKQFQPPSAYLTGEYTNRTTSTSIAFGVNVTVINPGRYELQGGIVDDYGEELDQNSVQIDLQPGNATILLQFDPTRFMSQGEVSSVHLVNLALSREDKVLEGIDDAWSLESINPQAFKAGQSWKSGSSRHSPVKLGGANGVRLENGTTTLLEAASLAF